MMEEKRTVSRRNFFVGSIAAAAGAALGSRLAPAAFAEEAVGDSGTVYASVLPEEYRDLYVRKVDCPGPIGPIAFEDREIDESEIVRTEECDVLVIGAGIAGLVATLKAAKEGAHVITLEKMTKGRGCFECFGAVDAACQKGVAEEVDKPALLDEIYRAAYWRTRPEPARTYVNRSGEATDFLQEMLDGGKGGFIISRVEQAPNDNGFPVFDTEVGFYDTPSLPADAGIRSGLSGLYVCQELAAIAANTDGADMRYATPAVQLETDSTNRCIGCIAKDADGYFRVTASQGVILCSGGYDANPDMVEAYCRPEDYLGTSWWNPGWGTTGDGHMMGLKIGATMDPVPQPVMNFSWGNPDSFYSANVWNPAWFGIMVNDKGERFCNEHLPFQAASNAIQAQAYAGHTCYFVFDSSMFFPEMGDDETCMDDYIAKGWAYKGSSIEELAQAIGADAETFAATVETYNSYFVSGKDADFNRGIAGSMPFSGGTYYALVTNNCILATVGGLTINGNCQVINSSDEVITGLYAAGNASGNFFSGNYPRHIPGTSIGRAITFGYVSAEHAVKGE